MSNQLFANNATSLLAANLTNVGTSVQVAAGQGSLFPNPAGTQYFLATIEDNAGNVEIVKCTGRAADILTVVRAQEGTVAQAFTANLARVEVRDTAGTLGNFLQKNGDTLTGPLNGGAQTITNVVLGANVSMEGATEIVDTPIRGVTGNASNQLLVPTDGSRATAGGAKILCAGDALPAFVIGQVIMWYGAAASVPAGWHVCDGSSPTNSVNAVIPVPDLRDKFVYGAGGSQALGATGGSTTINSSGGTAAGTTGGHALTTAEMPAHTHNALAFRHGASGGGGTTVADNDGSVPGSFSLPIPTDSTGGGGAHTHSIPSLAVTGVTATNVLPPYEALYFIMYIG